MIPAPIRGADDFARITSAGYGAPLIPSVTGFSDRFAAYASRALPGPVAYSDVGSMLVTHEANSALAVPLKSMKLTSDSDAIQNLQVETLTFAYRDMSVFSKVSRKEMGCGTKNLSALNYELFFHRKKYQKVSDVISKWRLIGIAQSVTSQGKSSFHSRFDLVSVAVTGCHKNINHWGSDFNGDKLYLVLEKVEIAVEQAASKKQATGAALPPVIEHYFRWVPELRKQGVPNPRVYDGSCDFVSSVMLVGVGYDTDAKHHVHCYPPKATIECREENGWIPEKRGYVPSLQVARIKF